MRLAKSAIAIAALVVAFVAWRDAAATIWLTAPDLAPPPLQSEPGIALAVSDQAVLDDRQDRPGFWPAVRSEAKRALRQGPLDAVAVRQLGLAAEAAGQPGLSAYLKLAERISRRDVLTEIGLLRLASEANDYPRTFLLLDTILTTKPAMYARFFAPIAALLADEDARRIVARYGARPWFPDFAAAAVGEVKDPADLATLLIDSRAKLPPDQSAVLPRLLARLADAGQYGPARDLAMRFGGAPAAALDRFGLSHDTTDPRFTPLTWRLIGSDTGEAGLAADDALEVNLRPGSVMLAADRVTGLAPGAYTLQQDVAGDDNGGRLLVAWELLCGVADRRKPVWRQPLPIAREPSRQQARLTVPGDCPIQHWRLTALADDAQSDATFRISALRIDPSR